MGVEQDVKVRAVDVIRPNICGCRTGALTVGNGALYPANADLFPEMDGRRLMKKARTMRRDEAYSVSSIHITLEGKLG